MPDSIRIQIENNEIPIVAENLVEETLIKTIKKVELQTSNSCRENNCLLLKDTTLECTPSHFKEYFKHFQLENMTIADICFQLIYLIALETGFAELNVFKACEEELQSGYIVTSYYNAYNVRCLVKYKPKFERHKSGTIFSIKLCSIANEAQLSAVDLTMAAISTLLTGVVTGEFFIITATPLQKENSKDLCCTRSICLSMPRYVIGLMSVENKNKKSLNDCLRNMEEFAHKLRDEIFVPLRSYHFTMLELDTYPALLGLPLEAYETIFKYLNKKQLNALANVNRQFYETITDKNQDVLSFQSASSRPTDEISTVSSYFEVEPYYI